MSPRTNDDAQDEIRRVQIGAIGIVAVLLLIGLASTLGVRNSNAVQATGAQNGTASASGSGALKSEPLVELGVQPAAPNDVAKTPASANTTGTNKSGAPNSATVPPALLPPSQPVPVRADGSVPDLRPDPKAQKAVQPN